MCWNRVWGCDIKCQLTKSTCYKWNNAVLSCNSSRDMIYGECVWFCNINMHLHTSVPSYVLSVCVWKDYNAFNVDVAWLICNQLERKSIECVYTSLLPKRTCFLWVWNWLRLIWFINKALNLALEIRIRLILDSFSCTLHVVYGGWLMYNTASSAYSRISTSGNRDAKSLI